MLSNLLLYMILAVLTFGGCGFVFVSVEVARREREVIDSTLLLVGAFLCFGSAWSIANHLGL